MLRPRFHVYHPTHGPQVWPWWKLLVVSVVRGSHDPYWYFWITPIAYNVWFYTRWGAWCWSYRVRNGVYDRAVLCGERSA